MCNCQEKAFEKRLAEKYSNRDKDERCLVRRYFEEQAKLPSLRRSSTAMIYCSCKRCNPYTL